MANFGVVKVDELSSKLRLKDPKVGDVSCRVGGRREKEVSVVGVGIGVEWPV